MGFFVSVLVFAGINIQPLQRGVVMDRGGSLPVNALVNLCFSGKTKAEVKKLLGSEAGVYSYLGTRDFRAVEDRAFSGDAEARLIFDALVYQHCKDIGAMKDGKAHIDETLCVGCKVCAQVCPFGAIERIR